MFDLYLSDARTTTTTTADDTHRPPYAATPAPIPPYAGPDRRTVRPPHWLAATLDEVDYGMLLLARNAVVVHVNRAARSELDAAHPLQVQGGTLQALSRADAAPLADALRGATRGLRKLLTLGEGAHRVGISVVPLAVRSDDPEAPTTLLMLGKREVCEVLSMHGFARGHGLTAAEARVLSALCRGTPPTEIASQLGVAISTVRTQIGHIRLKTGAQSIRALVRQVAVLPPVMGVLA